MYKHTFYYFLGNKKYPEIYILPHNFFLLKSRIRRRYPFLDVCCNDDSNEGITGNHCHDLNDGSNYNHCCDSNNGSNGNNCNDLDYGSNGHHCCVSNDGSNGNHCYDLNDGSKDCYDNSNDGDSTHRSSAESYTVLKNITIGVPTVRPGKINRIFQTVFAKHPDLVLILNLGIDL